MYDLENLIKHTQKLNLLYVEDNEEARATTLLVLREFFDNIVVAVNGEEGLEKFKANSIDIIISDINMPKLNGLDMIREIRKLDADILIFVLSAYNESGFFMDSIKLGVEGYLLKPLEMEQFLGILNKVAKKLQLAQDAKLNLHFLKEYEELTNSSAIVSKSDTDGNITFVNDKFCEATGYSREELIGKNHNIIRHKEMSSEFFEHMWDTIKNKKKIWHGIIKIMSKHAQSLYMDATIKPLLNEHGEIVEYIALQKDITEVMNPKKQLIDVTKNLTNPLVIYMKIEDYDTIEDLYDTNTVEIIQDKIKVYLESVVAQLCNFPKVYQLGNGVYALAQDKDTCIDDLDQFLENLKKLQKQIKNDRIDIGPIDYDIAVLISVAYGGEKILESAMLGIRKLLRENKNFIIANNLATEELTNAKNNINTIAMIKTALQSRKIVSYFQPIINNKTQKIEKYESLVRLINEDEKVLSPYFFLDISKKSKHYSLITEIVLEHSFSTLTKISQDISINLSAIDIEEKTTRDKIYSLLDQHKDICHRLVFELLEDENVKDFNVIKEFIETVKKLGVQIAIDDFGAGYSNFERLIDFSPDILKIDGSLIANINTNAYSLSVVKTIVAFAKEQNIKTVAEFVESKDIFDILNSIGVDYSQGYYFGKPENMNGVDYGKKV